jgi:hypothetical protein
MPLNDLQKCALALLARQISGSEPGTDAYKQAIDGLVSKNTIGELTEHVKGVNGRG